jgi:bis(5'-nucleosidyl)-tetraphosphatase
VRSCGVVLFRKVSAEGETAKFEFLLMKVRRKFPTPQTPAGRRKRKKILTFFLKHPNRYDLSKGHQEEGENDVQTAQREVHEETGIAPEFVSLARGFTFIETYYPKYKRFGGQTVEKTICIFAGLASAEGVSHLKLTEHSGCVWMPWTPPHTSIQKNTIDPLVLNLEKYFKKNPIDSAETWSGF